jgi:hypothetical protein
MFNDGSYRGCGAKPVELADRIPVSAENAQRHHT